MRQIKSILIVFFLFTISISSVVNSQGPNPTINLSCESLNPSYIVDQFNETYRCTLTNPTGYEEKISITLTGVDTLDVIVSNYSVIVYAQSSENFTISLSSKEGTRLGYYTVDVAASVEEFNGAQNPNPTEKIDTQIFYLETNTTYEDIWSFTYYNQMFPWGGDDRSQFRQYYDYFSLKDRMNQLANQNPDIISFHEGMNGGLNKRGQETITETYEGWFYEHSSPWVKITGAGSGVQGGECNEFVGDCGNYAEIPDIQLVGAHSGREWMSFEVPMMF